MEVIIKRKIIIAVLFLMLLVSAIGSVLSDSRIFRFIALTHVIILGIALYLIFKKDFEGKEIDEDKSERELPAGEKMAYIGTVAAGLAHEIRNPLNAIDFNIRMIQEDLESGEWVIDDITERFSSTYKEIKHLERLVSDFLLYARERVLHLSETDLRSLLESVREILSEEAIKRNVKVNISTANDLPVIQADFDVLRQALFNIVKNGLEAVDDGGILALEAFKNNEDNSVVIKITDNGCGINPRNLRKVFHLFYTTRRSGTGLGLPVAKSVIENHNGRIDVQSHEGAGTSFIITLPVEQGKSSSESEV